MRRLIAFATFAAVALILAAGLTTASADDSVVILVDEVTSQFPDGIIFNLSLETDSPVDDIRVFYKSPGADTISYGLLEFDKGPATQASFFLDTSVGSEGGTAFIPPGRSISLPLSGVYRRRRIFQDGAEGVRLYGLPL